jgi:N-acetylmuramoyl-L-alanine amidase
MSICKVCIDPGHGGDDNGADRPWFGHESDFVLGFSRKLCRVLSVLGVEASMTRFWDLDTSWDMRRSAAKGFDLVLPIHVNASKDPKRRGLQTFYWAGNANGRRIAKAIANSAPTELRRTFGSVVKVNRHTSKWKDAAAVVGAYRQTAVLVELCYASNLRDAELLHRLNIEIELIGAIIHGIMEAKIK